jgi:hypothetical protein
VPGLEIVPGITVSRCSAALGSGSPEQPLHAALAYGIRGRQVLDHGSACEPDNQLVHIHSVACMRLPRTKGLVTRPVSHQGPDHKLIDKINSLSYRRVRQLTP